MSAPTKITDRITQLDQSAVRFLRQFKPKGRRLAAELFREKQATLSGPWRLEDFQECMSMVIAALTSDAEDCVTPPPFDEETAKAALESYREGRYRTTEDILNELP